MSSGIGWDQCGRAQLAAYQGGRFLPRDDKFVDGGNMINAAAGVILAVWRHQLECGATSRSHHGGLY